LPTWIYAEEQRQLWHKTPSREGIKPKARPNGGAFEASIKNLKHIPADQILRLPVAVDNATPIRFHITIE
jgi:hypothetical protein